MSDFQPGTAGRQRHRDLAQLPPIEAATYYDDARHREVLLHYQKSVAQGSVTVPVAALDCLDRLRQLGKLLLISSDRGFTSAEAISIPDHPLALHRGLLFAHGQLPRHQPELSRGIIDSAPFARWCPNRVFQ